MNVLETVTFRWIETHLHLYRQICRAVAEERESRSGRAKKTETMVLNQTVSDPTASQTIKTLTPIKAVVVVTGKPPHPVTIRKPEEWIEVIEMTYKHFYGKQIGEMLDRRYNKHHEVTKIYVDMGIDRSTYYEWRNTAITFTALACCQVGLLKVC